MKRVEQTGPYHHAFFASLSSAIRNFDGLLPKDEMLALSAQLVGNLAEMQDGALYTKEGIEATIKVNIELGRKQLTANKKAG